MLLCSQLKVHRFDHYDSIIHELNYIDDAWVVGIVKKKEK